jgi:hypothetical protein
VTLRVAGHTDAADSGIAVEEVADERQRTFVRPERLGCVSSDHEHLVDRVLTQPTSELRCVLAILDHSRRQMRNGTVIQLEQRTLDSCVAAMPLTGEQVTDTCAFSGRSPIAWSNDFTGTNS